MPYDGPVLEEAIEKEEEAPRPMGRRYCMGCQQDLGGLLTRRCPECGREFNPADPETTLGAPTPAWRRSLIMKHGVRMALLLAVILGFTTTVFPRPRLWNDWRLWLWFGQPIGVLNVRHGDHEIYAHYWFGEELRREAIRVDNGRLAWCVEDRGANRYRVRALEANIEARALRDAFNSIKGPERFFGVRLGQATRQASGAPFEIEGDEVEVFSRIMREFGYQLTPFRLRPDQRYVWTWDPLAQRMSPVDLTPESAEQFPLDDSNPDRVLIPKPR